MSYAIRFAPGHDMGAIRARVAARGALFDAVPGLRAKAFMLDARPGREEYALVYVWESPDAMQGFLAGPLFAALVTSFGRPKIETWLVQGMSARPKVLPTPSGATLVDRAVDAGETPDSLEQAARRWTAQARATQMRVALLDPRNWVERRLTLGVAASAADDPADNLGARELLYVAGSGGSGTTAPALTLTSASA
ncbi:MAG: DUF4865 family protein [Alphaproteobacteria bacterium]|nr:DUF4865 family protein [Alphaproteobacteria bacterium]